ncbi:MAG: DinB family protein [Fimbriimonadaceae bacterium]
MKCEEFLENFEGRFKDQIERVKKVTEGLTDEDYGKEAEPGVWGIGHILGHLNISTESYISPMEAAISGGANDSGGEAKHTFFAGLIIGGMHRPNIPVPGSMMPSGTRSRADLEKWLEITDKVLRLFEQAKGKDLVANQFKNPFLPIGRFNLMDGFEIIVEHTERHVRQMEERIGKIRG